MEKNTIINLTEASVYQDDKLILSNINTSIMKGELLYIIGRVGSGKSSLLKTMYAELPLISGEINFAGFQLSKIKSKEIPYLRRKTGIVFQDFQLLTDRSVFANLEFVLKATGWKKKDEIKKRIQDVLERVHLLDKMNVYPHELSGGEQQRVVIARALLNQPDVILADEPTGNLDPQSSEEILDLLIEISHLGKAVIIATHDYRLIQKHPSRILKCENGKLSEVSYDSITTEDELLSRFKKI